MTRQDLMTIYAAAVRMARADRNVADLEQEIVERFGALLAIDAGQRAALLDEAPPPEEAARQLSSPEAQAFLVKVLCAVAFSDGQRHEREIDLVERTNAGLSQPVRLRPWEEWETYIEEVVETLQGLDAAS